MVNALSNCRRLHSGLDVSVISSQLYKDDARRPLYFGWCVGGCFAIYSLDVRLWINMRIVLAMVTPALYCHAERYTSDVV